MRVLVLSNLFPPGFIGGYELAARDVARTLARRGHAVTVLSSPALDGLPDPAEPYAVLRHLECVGFSPDRLRPRDQWLRGVCVSLRNLDAVRAALAGVRPDAVLCFNLAGLGALGVLRLLGAVGIPTVAFVMDNWFAGVAGHRDEFAAFRRVFAVGGDVFCGARVVGCSHHILAEVGDEVGADLSHAVRIPAWVELDGLSPGELVCGEEPRFVFASQVVPHKGIERIVQAVALLRDAGLAGTTPSVTPGFAPSFTPSFTVDVFGGGLAAQAAQYAHAHSVETLIRFRGKTTKAEMLQQYHRYDALLFATWEREPSGFVASEAAASGCLPIMTATMGGAEYFLDGHDCIKVSLDPGSLAEAMRRVTAMAPAQRLAWRSRLRRSAQRLFDARRWYDRIEQLLREGVQSAGGPARSPEGPFQAMALLAQQWST